MDTSDRDLIVRVLDGERECFRELVRRHAGPIWSTVRAAVRNAEDARDVFQETWLRAFERLHALRDPRRFRAWLVSIARNEVRQRMRRGGALDVETTGGDDAIADAGAREGFDDLARSEELDGLRALIVRLPERQREVLDLRLNHELSHAEIADTLGITPENSRANYYQALRKLRAWVDDDEVTT